MSASKLTRRMIPAVAVKNEYYYIQTVLRPLLDVFGLVLVGDTGSSDGTAELAAALPGVILTRFGLTPIERFHEVRYALGLQALELGAEWLFQVDGDELYTHRSLAHLLNYRIPPGPKAGYTAMLTIDPAEDGTVWELDDLFSRLALMPPQAHWSGGFFDVPEVAGGTQGNFYVDLPPDLRYHAVHLHRFVRSNADGEVFLRLQKQKQFAMQDKVVPRTRLFNWAAWLGS